MQLEDIIELRGPFCRLYTCTYMQRKKKINIIGLEKYNTIKTHTHRSRSHEGSKKERKTKERKKDRFKEKKKLSIKPWTIWNVKPGNGSWTWMLVTRGGEKKSMATFNGGHRVRDGVTRCRLDVWRVAEGTVPPPFPDATLHAVRFSPCPRGVLSSH